MQLHRTICRNKIVFIPCFGECLNLRHRRQQLCVLTQLAAVSLITLTPDESGRHYIRNVETQFILIRLTVREDFITALCRLLELSLRPSARNNVTTSMPCLTSPRLRPGRSGVAYTSRRYEVYRLAGRI
jgi:hypothetical protein